MPTFLPPQFPKLVERPPSGEKWVHEIKFDGYRTQLRVQRGQAVMRTRNGHDWTDRYLNIGKAARRLPDCIVDGEMVALDGAGQPDFPGLLDALGGREPHRLVYFAFDCLWSGARDLRSKTLLQRKAILEPLIKDAFPLIRYSEHVETGGQQILTAACRSSLEGIVSKISSAPYVAGKGVTWVKSKCRPGQEVVIGGWTSKGGAQFRSLLMGVNEPQGLVYVGKVGTGYGGKVLDNLMPQLQALRSTKSPFAGRQPTSSGEIHFVKPRLVAEVAFAAWTGDRLLRQASFKGLRKDKEASAITFENAAAES